MTDSILNSTKKSLGIASDYTEFDLDIILLINSAFSTLHQLGVGPIRGFMIEDASTTWDAFILGDNRLNSAKTYVYLKVRSVFDPPTTSFLLTAMQETIKELEWRLNVVREGVVYGAPIPNNSDTCPPNGVFDGGTPSGTATPIPVPVNENTFDGGRP